MKSRLAAGLALEVVLAACPIWGTDALPSYTSAAGTQNARAVALQSMERFLDFAIAHERGHTLYNEKDDRKANQVVGMLQEQKQATAELITAESARPLASSSINTTPTPKAEVSKDRHPQIVLLVHDYANVDAGFLVGAEEIAAGILRQAKVDLKWVNCRLTQAEGSPFTGCQVNMGTTTFVLNVLTPTMARRIQTRGEALGYSLTPCDDDATSCSINVFYFRVGELAARSSIIPPRLLGHVFAHELGHVLLGVDHSSKGVMRGAWGRNDLEVIGRSILSFTPDQAEQMRTTLLRRAMRQELAQGVDISTRH